MSCSSFKCVFIQISDSSAPVFDSCPSSQIVYADELETTAIVTWEEPMASDNSGETVVPVQTEGQPSGSMFTQNYHVIEYTATDSSDMFSTCTFTITVQGTLISYLICWVYMAILSTTSCSNSQII